jgi:hypothetical protein
MSARSVSQERSSKAYSQKNGRRSSGRLGLGEGGAVTTGAL